MVYKLGILVQTSIEKIILLRCEHTGECYGQQPWMKTEQTNRVHSQRPWCSDNVVLHILQVNSPILWPHNLSAGRKLGESYGPRKSGKTKA